MKLSLIFQAELQNKFEFFTQTVSQVPAEGQRALKGSKVKWEDRKLVSVPQYESQHVSWWTKGLCHAVSEAETHWAL